MHLLITDSGLGGLSICAALEAILRARRGGVRITYLNAWPEEGRGYNDLPDVSARARVFDLALDAIEHTAPDLILVACNTLSIVYQETRHRRGGRTPVEGIIEAGVQLFADALLSRPPSSLVLVGTRTTIESEVHRDRLLARGVAADRLGAASCHGLATAIENGATSAATAALIDVCAERAASAAPEGELLCLGLCCTHYGIVGPRLGEALGRRTGRRVQVLDPNARLVDDIARRVLDWDTERAGIDEARVTVEVLSKVTLSVDKRNGFAAALEPVSPSTAHALRAYTHVPDLF